MSERPMPAADRYTVVVRNLVLMVSIGVRRVERERLQRVRVSVENIDIYPDAEAVGAILERTRPA